MSDHDHHLDTRSTDYRAIWHNFRQVHVWSQKVDLNLTLINLLLAANIVFTTILMFVVVFGGK